MNEKIMRFLQDAGFEGTPSEPVAIQLLRFFEEEYDVSLLPLLEQEWVDEQLEREMTSNHFQTLRAFIDDKYLADYDEALAKIDTF